MRTSLLIAVLVGNFCVAPWGQSAFAPDNLQQPGVANENSEHARDPVGFELVDGDGRDPNNPSYYPDEVVSAIQTRWYQTVSELRQTSYGQQGVAVVAFRVKRDGSVGKAAIAERSGEERLDSAALSAVRSASPFKPFRKDYTSKSTAFRVHLGYNQPTPR